MRLVYIIAWSIIGLVIIAALIGIIWVKTLSEEEIYFQQIDDSIARIDGLWHDYDKRREGEWNSHDINNILGGIAYGGSILIDIRPPTQLESYHNDIVEQMRPCTTRLIYGGHGTKENITICVLAFRRTKTIVNDAKEYCRKSPDCSYRPTPPDSP